MSVINRTGPKQDQLFQFTQGIDLDQRLYRQEIRVQKAWARALEQGGYINASESSQLCTALEGAEKAIAEGRFVWREQDEDIHMNLERALTEELGEVGKKVHLGRSRNDLIATTLRLFVADACREVKEEVKAMVLALVHQAEIHMDVIIPGQTHQQNAQPVRYSHMISAHGWALTRDLKKLDDVILTALAYCPLGSAALTGTTVQVDLTTMAEQLGFQAPSLNSYDAVGDRDFMLDALDCFATIAVHLSRLSADIIYWASTPVGLLVLPEAWSTGSSIMPNKRNPDVAELVRAKSAEIMGFAAAGKALLKGMPSSYSSDLHELKRVLMQSLDQLRPSLVTLTELVNGLGINKARAQELLGEGHILATEYANQLTQSGMPFREAYTLVAKWVKASPDGNYAIPEKFQLHRIEFEDVVEARVQIGGTARTQVAQSLRELRQRLDLYK